MFENEIAINEFQMDYYQKIVNDIADDSLFQPGAGHGHPPVWILGHLAITGEFGQRMLGGSVTHPEWLRLFGPGSSDRIAATESLNKPLLHSAIVDCYRSFRELAANATQEAIDKPHQVAIFAGTPIKTVGNCVALLLTNHFAFHLSQLSACPAPLF